MIINTIPQATISSGYMLLIAAAIGMATIGGVAYIFKVLISNLLSNYFDSIKEKNQEFKSFNVQLTEIVLEMKQLVMSLENHKEYDDDFRRSVDTRFSNSIIDYKERIDELNLKFKHGIEEVRRDINHIKIVEEEHYKELKGKISKQWENLNNIKDKVNALIAERDIFHANNFKKS